MPDAPRQLERDAGAAEVRVGVGRAVASGGAGGRWCSSREGGARWRSAECGWRSRVRDRSPHSALRNPHPRFALPLVVIRHDQIDAALARDLRRLDRGDAAVDGDDQLGAVVAELRDRLGVEAVAFVDAVGDVEVGVAAEDADGVPEDGGGGDAVDVVVAVDDDLFAVADRPGDALGGLASGRGSGPGRAGT